MTWPDPDEDRATGYIDFTGMPSRAELMLRYADASGLPIDAMDYYLVLDMSARAHLLTQTSILKPTA